MRQFTRFIFLLLFPALLTACSADEPAGSELRQYTIASHRIYVPDAISNMPVLCLLVKPEGAARWQNFYSPIEGFDYTAGTEYDVELEVIPVVNPPADASSSRFRLHRIIGRQTKTSEGLPEGAVLE